MFTGIIEEVGTMKKINRSSYLSSVVIKADEILKDIHIGDSIAVNGVCLTVIKYDNSYFEADVMNETFKRSTINRLKSGDKVNLERAMKIDRRFGGHIVYGHVDGTGIIKNIKKDDNAVIYTIQADKSILKYIIEKGSVAIDGISLTVVDVNDKEFKVSIIPHSKEETTFKYRNIGDSVNIENDCIGKYIEKLLFSKDKEKGLTEGFLKKFGY
ncbi:riboflavin synthase [Clostridium sp. BJN0001]|uniref:riboflavin synthase n=1 Tax=Clostridium sp. BJN0001 TaxID=2930219 RepID=UPI001FD266DE|nr:riboflavin synthase [Clostridium sp. BJN0001]